MGAWDVVGLIAAGATFVSSLWTLSVGVAHHTRTSAAIAKVVAMILIGFAVFLILVGPVFALVVGKTGIALTHELIFGVLFAGVAVIQMRILAAVRQHAAWLSLAERAEDSR